MPHNCSTGKTSLYGVCGILFHPLPLLRSLARWPVHHFQHHTTVFGSVLTGGMSCLSFARSESAQSLRFPQSPGDSKIKMAHEVINSSLLSLIPSEISGHRKGRSCWALEEVKPSAPLLSHMTYTSTLIKSFSLWGWLGLLNTRIF